LAHANGGDVGVVRPDLAHQFAQLRVQVHAFDVHGQARRLGHEGLFGGERRVRFDRDARIVLRGPDTHGHDGGPARDLLRAQQQRERASLQQGAAVQRR